MRSNGAMSAAAPDRDFSWLVCAEAERAARWMTGDRCASRVRVLA
jgi:hypothetical protein